MSCNCHRIAEISLREWESRLPCGPDCDGKGAMSEQHSPPPWELSHYTSGARRIRQYWKLNAADGRLVATFHNPNAKAKAQLALRAVNAHSTHLALLEQAEKALKVNMCTHDRCDAVSKLHRPMCVARAAFIPIAAALKEAKDGADKEA